MTLSPKTWPRDLRAAALAFSLTLVVALMAWQSGLAATATSYLGQGVEMEVVLLFVPLCALVFAMVVEVTNFAMRGLVPKTGSRRAARAARYWEPGHLEG